MLSTQREVLNINFVLFTFFKNNCPKFVRNFFMPGRNFSCPEFVRLDLSRICPEFCLSRICPELVRFYLSGICPEFCIPGICPVYLSGICPEFCMPGICPVLFARNLSRILHAWNLSGFIVRDLSRIFYVQNLSGQIPDIKKFRTSVLIKIPDKFQTLQTFSGHF